MSKCVSLGTIESLEDICQQWPGKPIAHLQARPVLSGDGSEFPEFVGLEFAKNQDIGPIVQAMLAVKGSDSRIMVHRLLSTIGSISGNSSVYYSEENNAANRKGIDWHRDKEHCDTLLQRPHSNNPLQWFRSALSPTILADRKHFLTAVEQVTNHQCAVSDLSNRTLADIHNNVLMKDNHMDQLVAWLRKNGKLVVHNWRTHNTFIFQGEKTIHNRGRFYGLWMQKALERFGIMAHVTPLNRHLIERSEIQN